MPLRPLGQLQAEESFSLWYKRYLRIPGYFYNLSAERKKMDAGLDLGFVTQEIFCVNDVGTIS